MKKINKLRKKIEIARIELNRSFVEDEFDVYYQKNLKLDRLIEEYMDLQEKKKTVHQW